MLCGNGMATRHSPRYHKPPLERINLTGLHSSDHGQLNQRNSPVLRNEIGVVLLQRRTVELAWLGNRRRLLVGWERLLTVYQGCFTRALMLIALNRLLK